jgi:hypothetical protein
MSENNGEIWGVFAAVRREIKSLRATVERLERCDTERFLFRQRLHDVTRCDVCHEVHECAVLPHGPVTVGGNGLRAVCESCLIRGRERQAARA